ncbi:MAG: hypothetical protein A2381_00915 [Bdellovibrionales bacterium RIFOXYB1_FULL_37_110]|nr:MAG: hypothetical protein A2417_01770 [Bdellovibrionales bacterium RIFOXYC1_FULL_37_79]OFZ58781.1 MAG: hypothetical protein A2381_00915 [Bdellovibrionales bacterium RIFOXYB1_FULL_37_110]OFZ64780.1 MAG: hypothetical protein A2577_06915 [Bdellovibrionales bacterium RIFOXYD1_FULL_36_51]OGT97923.1 MAG: hypothetical protein A2298_04735 [Gammaproteobacteria bacterium RIFOXYB2_FULL_38_6]
MIESFALNPRVGKAVLFMADLCLIIIAMVATHVVRFGQIDAIFSEAKHTLIYFFIILSVYYIFDLYRVQNTLGGIKAPGKTFIAATMAFLLMNIYVYLLGPENYSGLVLGRGIMAIFFGIFALATSTIRYLVIHLLVSVNQKYPWFFISSSYELDTYTDLSHQRTFPVYELIKINYDINHDQELVAKLTGLQKKDVGGIVILDSLKLSPLIEKELMRLKFSGIRILTLTQFYEKMLFKIPLSAIHDFWFTTAEGFDLISNHLGLRIKRILDIIWAILIIALFLPFVILGCLLILLTSGLPIIYKQERVGEKGKPFTIYKLRTMVKNAEANGPTWSSENDARITFIGKILRATRIDEIPQVINVLKGEMSFIGPRPERPLFVIQLENRLPYYNLRHLVKPGITGWAQINYPYGSSEEDARQKLQYDLYYIKSYSLIMDLNILLQTIRVVLFGKGR